MNGIDLLIPWQPSVTVVAATVLSAVLYGRGRRRVRVSLWRDFSWWLGLVLMYAALHTRLDYYAEREFFMHRLQHMVLHHVGPFLIALAWPGPVLRAGIPVDWRRRWFKPALAAKPVRGVLDFLLNPLVSGVLFVGLVWFWLIPVVHFYAMLDARLYRIMNWSMAVDGLLFWYIVLDPRRSPPARLRPGVRIMLAALTIPPQMAAGALVTLSPVNPYPLYELCGRAFSGISAAADLTLGGLILWIPSTMMSMVGALVALVYWFRWSERSENSRGNVPNLPRARLAR